MNGFTYRYSKKKSPTTLTLSRHIHKISSGKGILIKMKLYIQGANIRLGFIESACS